MTYYAGIDVSSRRLDVALIPEHPDAWPIWNHYTLEGHDAWERARSVRQAMPAASHWDAVVAIGVERPFGPSSGILNVVVGGVLATLPRRILVHPWPPSAWRKQISLSRQEGENWKQASERWALAHGCPGDWADDNAYDAFCLAHATMQAVEKQAA